MPVIEWLHNFTFPLIFHLNKHFNNKEKYPHNIQMKPGSGFIFIKKIIQKRIKKHNYYGLNLRNWVTIKNLFVWKNKAANKSETFLNIMTSFLQLLSIAKTQQVLAATVSDCADGTEYFNLVLQVCLETHIQW